MFNPSRLLRHSLAVIAIVALAGCETTGTHWGATATPTTAPSTRPTISIQPAITNQAAIRIKAGRTTPFKDAAGNTWLADTGADSGFADGDPAERDATLAIANTTEPELYRTERYGMTSFSRKVPNGHYTVKLYFAETYTEGITQAGERVFNITVQDKTIKNFDVWAKAGGALKAYIETVPVDVKDGTLTIKFEAVTQNAEINAIEIIPG